MWVKGWKVVYFPRASVVHYVGGSSDKALARSVLEFHKSSYRLFKKYSKLPLWFVRPLVIAGISLRVCFILAFNAARLWCEKHKFAVRHNKSIVFPKRGEDKGVANDSTPDHRRCCHSCPCTDKRM